jgi:hypothetical protein
MQNEVNSTSQIEELSRIFDLLLLFLSIITAVLFQYTSSIEPLRIEALNPSFDKQQLFQEVNKSILLYLRIFFIPIIVLISLWILKRFPSAITKKWNRLLPEFCYAFCFNILTFDIYLFVLTSFPSLAAIGDPVYLVTLVLQFLVPYPFVYYYEKPFIKQKRVKTRWQKFKSIWWPVLTKTYTISLFAWIVNALIFVVCLIPFAG